MPWDIQGNALEQYFSIQFLIKVITFSILESMTNYFPSTEAIQEGSLVSCSVWMLEHDMGKRDISQTSSIGFHDVTCS